MSLPIISAGRLPQEWHMTAWFGREKFGVGWGPASWQGWLIVAVYGLVEVPIGHFFPLHTAGGLYYAAVGVATLALLIVGVATPRPFRHP